MKKLGFDTDKSGRRAGINSSLILPNCRKDTFIEFDSVAMQSKSFKQQELDNHTGMFSRFAFDLT